MDSTEAYSITVETHRAAMCQQLPMALCRHHDTSSLH